MTISLGSHDDGIPAGALDALLAEMRKLSDAPWESLRDDGGAVPFRPVAAPGASGGGADPGPGVADVQRALIGSGFLDGGRVDGICGYRTRAAIRLFQEYVRTVEGRACLPDGIVGPRTAAELRRWSGGGLRASWSPRIAAWREGLEAGGAKGDPAANASPGTPPAASSGALDGASIGDGARGDEFGRWLDFLDTLRRHRLAAPDATTRAIAAFAGESDTRSPADWRVGPEEVHLIGVRHGEKDSVRTFDDVLVLLIKGLVFHFQGSTDPGTTSNAKGAPFLVRGQHDFRMGLHRGQYHALRPRRYATHGVLVVRCRDGLALNEEDLAAGLEANGTINIHWGGKGMSRRVGSWSEGCQVVAGGGYRNHDGALVDCLDHVGINNKAVASSRGRLTRGAYTVLSDLIVALSGDLPEPGVVRYTLLHDSELGLDADLAAHVSALRTATAERIAASGG